MVKTRYAVGIVKVLALGLAILFGMVACSPALVPLPASTPTIPPSTPTILPSTTLTPLPPTPSTLSPNPTPEGYQEVQVTLVDFEFIPAEIVVKPGRVRFILSNQGRFTHKFVVQTEGFQEGTRNIGASRTAYLDVVLKEGTYKLYCPLGGGKHEQRGSRGILIVKE